LPLPLTLTGDDVKTRLPAVQDTAALGPYSLNVIVPVGETPLSSVAVSETVPPSLMAAEALVVSDGVPGVTVTVSFTSLHAPATALLLASPL
jgi:hypothetical protein